MGTKRKVYSAEFKSRVALEALRGLKTVPTLCAEFEVHPAQINQWKKQLKEGATEIFTKKRGKQIAQRETEEAKLFEEIGRLKIELDWLKKKTISFN